MLNALNRFEIDVLVKDGKSLDSSRLVLTKKDNGDNETLLFKCWSKPNMRQ